MGVAKGLAALEAASAGTGPGNVAGSENSGRASSRKLNVGIADESTAPKEPGIAGEGGCGVPAERDCGISVNNEDGMDAKPSSLGRVLSNAEAGVF
jgi:hypothetical protein